MSDNMSDTVELEGLLEQQSYNYQDNNEDDGQDKNATESGNAQPSSIQDKKSCLIGYLLLVTLLMAQTGGILSSQMVTGKTNIFQINTMRYIMQVLFSSVTAVGRGKSLFIERKYIKSVLIWGVSNITAASCLFFTASFFPVGNLEAFVVISLICFSTVVDLVKRKIKLRSIAASLFAITGVILLVQPWNIATERYDVLSIPCDYWDNVSTTYGMNSSNSSLTSYESKGSSHLSTNISGSTTPQYSVYIDGKEYPILINPIYLGYVLIFSYSVITTFLAYFIKDLTTDIDPSPLLFWLGLLEGLCSLITAIIWSSVNNNSPKLFPSGMFCVLFTCMYVICLGSTNIMLAFALGHFNVSKIAISKIMVTVLLYISQRTWLKPFHPGHANVIEVCGTVTAVCAVLVSPVLEFWQKTFFQKLLTCDFS